MKVLVSHDVDHIGFYEHMFDGIAEKFFIRSFLELAIGRISFGTLHERIRRSRKNSWNNIEAILDFDSNNGIPSTFFVGVSNGLGLSYGFEDAVRTIQLIQRFGFDVGVHGIAFDDPILVKKEHDKFLAATGKGDFGIRLHYLRLSSTTKSLLNQAGYLYDATELRFGGPSMEDNLVELPITVMDGRLLEQKPFGVQVCDFELVMDRTRRIIETAETSGSNYFSLLFHDRYFSSEYPFWKRWYIQTILLLKSKGHEFVSHRDTALSMISKEE